MRCVLNLLLLFFSPVLTGLHTLCSFPVIQLTCSAYMLRPLRQAILSSPHVSQVASLPKPEPSTSHAISKHSL
ncbi:hypothetical protein C8J57DRAFT_1295158 [Mycena rebaudengoi]|nr:hypothetical protein C8J57DRAFT_1295158 [Mycena rebaudengoi]